MLMGQTADRVERSGLFSELHTINQKLASDHVKLVELVGQQVAAAQKGLPNRRIASRRDWCFALYPPEAIEELQGMIVAMADL